MAIITILSAKYLRIDFSIRYYDTGNLNEFKSGLSINLIRSNNQDIPDFTFLNEPGGIYFVIKSDGTGIYSETSSYADTIGMRSSNQFSFGREYLSNDNLIYGSWPDSHFIANNRLIGYCFGQLL